MNWWVWIRSSLGKPAIWAKRAFDTAAHKKRNRQTGYWALRPKYVSCKHKTVHIKSKLSCFETSPVKARGVLMIPQVLVTAWGFGYNTTAFEYRVWSYDQSAWSEVPCTGRRCKILIMTIRSKDPILSLRAALIEKELGRKDWNLVSRVSLSLNLNIISWLWWCFQDCVGSTYTSVDIWLKLKLKLGLVDCKSSESQFNKNQ